MVLDLLALFSTIIGVATPRSRVAHAASRWWRHPGTWLLFVGALIFANQVLFNVYVIRIHHGDACFISTYLPSGWFSLASGDWIERFAAWFPWPGALSFTVLRTQAFLELPLVVAAYLMVTRWLDPALMRRLVAWRTLVPASVAYTVIFCVIEASLANPYTRSDIVIRIVSGLVTPVVFGLVLRAGDDRPARSLPQVLAFAASAGALGVLVLVMYDTVLLYNLGRVATDLPILCGAIVVLIVGRVAARRAKHNRAGPRLSTLTTGTSYALAWFFVPALPIRYDLLFGTRLFGLALGSLIVVAATAAAVRRTAQHVADQRRWLLGLVASAVTAMACGGLAAAIPMPYQEARLLVASAVFVVVATSVATALDRVQDLGKLEGL